MKLGLLRNLKLKLLLGFIVICAGFVGVRQVWADECENPAGLTDVNKIKQCISKVQDTYDAIAKANANNKETLAGLQRQIAGVQATIRGLEKSIVEKEKLIGVQDLAYEEQYARLSLVARTYYIRSKRDLGLGVLLTSKDIKKTISAIGLLSAVAKRDREVIANITETIKSLEEQKKSLADQKVNLEKVKVAVNEKAKFYEAEVAKASAYESSLSRQISSLSARQNEILAAKSGVFQTSVGEVPLSDDPNSRPDYNPGFSPAFAAFSFGAPHHKGMSQYGAFGRAKAGQNYEQIVKAYYGNVRVETVDTGFSIKTSAGSMHFEDRYILGIAEMPSSWGGQGGMEALKAQAIAARSYAMSYVGWRMGNRSASGSICVTESCQVWKASKADNPGAWRQAVSETRGKILVSNDTGEIISSWYSSTSGGYQRSYNTLGHNTPGLWDTPSGRGGWTSEAYENKAGSPWFYKGWYRDRDGSTCGRSHPWMNSEEFADMLNAWIVRYKGDSGEVGRVSPIDPGCWGGNPYSIGEMRQVASKYGGGYSSVNSVSVNYSTDGVTANLVFGTDKGSVTISGAEFKTAFNLRAPGRISIKSGLFNIEKK